MIYCNDCGKLMPCTCREESPSKPVETNKVIDSKKGTGRASKEIIQK